MKILMQNAYKLNLKISTEDVVELPAKDLKSI